MKLDLRIITICSLLLLHNTMAMSNLSDTFSNSIDNLFGDRNLKPGCAVGVINTNTEFFKKFFDVLDKMDDSRPVDALRILIMAYIRAEDEMSIKLQLDKQTLEKFRSVWSNHLEALIPIAHES